MVGYLLNLIIGILIFFVSNANLFADILPEVSKSSIDFGTVPYCMRPTDTIVVRNSSSSNGNFKLLVGEKIVGTDSANFKITNPKIKDLDLPPFDGSNAVIYVVEFNPSIGIEGIKNATLEIPTDLPNYPIIQISITGISAKVEYTIDPPTIDFGEITTGKDFQSAFNVEVKSSIPVKLNNIIKTKPELDVTFNDADSIFMPFDTKKTINFKINLPTETNFSDNIKLHFSEPCDTTLIVPVKAKGASSSITAILNINLGLLSACNNKDTTILLSFSGSGSGTIDSIGKITGNLNALFNATFPSPLPITLNSTNSTANLLISFNGDKIQSGLADITIPIFTTINGKQITLDFRVISDVKPVNLDVDVNSIIFSTLLPNSNEIKPIQITNNSNFDIFLDSFKISGNYNNYFKFNPAFNKFLILKNNSNKLNLEFLPTEANISAKDTLIIYYSGENCNDSLIIILSGNSFAKGKCDFSFNNMNNITINPKDNSLIIPLSLKSQNTGLFLQDTIEIEILFPRSIFYPTETTNSTSAKIIKNELVGDNRKLTIQRYFEQNLEANTTYLFAEISGTPLLGEVSSGTFEISKVEFLTRSDQYEIGNVENLNFTLQVCNLGAERLLKINNQVKPGIIDIKYQENDENVIFIFSAIEKGNYDVEIYDFLGNIIGKYKFYSNSYEISNRVIATKDLINGIYFIKIVGPSEIFTAKFIK